LRLIALSELRCKSSQFIAGEIRNRPVLHAAGGPLRHQSVDSAGSAPPAGYAQNRSSPGTLALGNVCPVSPRSIGIAGKFAANGRWSALQRTGNCPDAAALLAHVGNRDAVVGAELLISRAFLHVLTLHEKVSHFRFEAAGLIVDKFGNSSIMLLE
jgi:hypothetical protein